MAKKPKAPKEVEVAREASALVVPAPMALASIIGQEGAGAVLRDALRSERVHHCWIFHGPQGVGKFTTALAFAALLLDPTTKADKAGVFRAEADSQVQTLLRGGGHPDLHVIVKELAAYSADDSVRNKKQTNIPVGVLREFVLGPAALAPGMRTQSRAGKVFIIDEAEMLAWQGQNALLKLLEEPPERVVIILVTSSEDKLLPTIRSRSQRLYFGPLNEQEMRRWMTERALALDAAEQAWLLEFSGGAPGVLLAAHEQGIHGWWKKLGPLLESAEQGQFSIDFGPAMHQLAEEWAKKWVEEHDNASKEAANKVAADWLLRVIGLRIRQRLREAAGGPDAAAATRPYLMMIDKLREAEMEIDANVNGAFVTEKLSAEIAGAGG